jgi:hypothetical protein
VVRMSGIDSSHLVPKFPASVVMPVKRRGGLYFRGFRELTLIEVGIKSGFSQKSRVGAALDNTPVLYDKNLIRLQDGGKAMGDDHRSAACQGRFERPLDSGFGFGIEMGRGLVEDDNVRRLQEQAGDGDALFLTS